VSAPPWAWLALGLILSASLAADLWVGRRCRIGLGYALAASAAWIGAGIGFGVVFGVLAGQDLAGQYFAGYLLEKSLSIDNVFVIAMIFAAMGIHPAHQRRVLFYGVVGALVLRAGFISGGTALVDHFGWALDGFAVALLVAAGRMARGHTFDPGRSRGLRLLARLLPLSDRQDGERFLVRMEGHASAPGDGVG
jgi:tellurite resistance protein TerC